MKIKKVLFIDDQSVDNIVDKFAANLHKKGYKLKSSIVFIGDQKYKSENQNGEISLNFDAIKSDIEENHFHIRYDLVACDFNFANDDINGYSLIQWLKHTSTSGHNYIRKAKFVSYSSEEDKFKEHVLASEDIGKLIRLKLDGFFKRDNLADAGATLILKQDVNLDLSSYIVTELEKLADVKFNGVYPKFEGKTFAEIAHEIDTDSHHGQEFQKTMIGLTLAHMDALNKD
ncbi:hypothetical protein QKW35_13505 [Pontibacterium granulatum]|uniref:hypothetical protein n=1 Tax=Pontibacterium granulatum TaxID=2036029 RepID=UPI002499AE3F|nr:hypothetical protein [Pontibacterium granulatum]MDI3325393.1 hypothetical protein [Pontibacterium granulatum]